MILRGMKTPVTPTTSRRRLAAVAAASCLVTAGLTAGTASAANDLPPVGSQASNSTASTSSVPSTGNDLLDTLLGAVVGSSEKTDYLGSLVAGVGSLATGSLGVLGSWEVLPAYFGSGN